MKILLVTEFFPSKKQPIIFGGVQARTFFIEKYLRKKNEIEVVNLVGNGIQATTTSLFARLRSFINVIFYKPKIKPDILEASNVTTYFPAFLLAKRLKSPTVAWVPDLLGKAWWKNFPFLVALTGFLLEFISVHLSWDHVIAMSQSTKTKLIKAGVNEKIISVIYGGVEVDKLNKLKVKKFDNPTICSIARLVPYKRIEDLINAISIIKKTYPNIQCKIIGEGSEKSKFEKLIQKLNLQNNIKLLGNLPHNKTLTILKQSQICCLSSEVEGFGLVTIETMAAGVPYVNSNILPTLEITEDGKGGLLFETRNSKDLARKVLELLDNNNLYQKKVKQGQEFVKRYDWHIIAKETERVYLKLIKK